MLSLLCSASCHGSPSCCVKPRSSQQSTRPHCLCAPPLPSLAPSQASLPLSSDSSLTVASSPCGHLCPSVFHPMRPPSWPSSNTATSLRTGRTQREGSGWQDDHLPPKSEVLGGQCEFQCLQACGQRALSVSPASLPVGPSTLLRRHGLSIPLHITEMTIIPHPAESLDIQASSVNSQILHKVDMVKLSVHSFL